MKKVFAIFLVLVLVAPAMAIEFSATGWGSGRLHIYYTLTSGEVLRGMALRITVTSGDAAIDSTDDIVLQQNTFNFFPEYATENPDGYDIGEGHPLAEPAGGVLDLTTPRQDFVIYMYYLDPTGTQTGLTMNGYFYIYFSMSSDSVILITADTSRGGIVGDNITQPDPVTAMFSYDCYSGDQYWTWVGVGRPDCWCTSVNPRQCHGDADGLKQGKQNYWVSTNDLNILVAAWHKRLSELTEDNQICADFNHLSNRAYMRVEFYDLDILVANWQIANGPWPDCP
jgi:hypothetical protein